MYYDKNTMIKNYKKTIKEKNKEVPFELFSLTLSDNHIGFSFYIKHNFIVAFFKKSKKTFYEYKISLKSKKLLKSKNTKHNKKLYKIALEHALENPDFSKKYYS